MYKSINFHDHQITELQQAIKKLQADKTKQSDEPDKKVMTQVNASRAGGGLTLLTIQVFDQNDELVNVITTTSKTAHFNGENIKIIKDKEVETFGTKGDK
ncbi:hypothetical protein EFA59_05920 [Weissella hellenica]|nr:hypothetical protein EFA59_05920 [Weissella hellenica]